MFVINSMIFPVRKITFKSFSLKIHPAYAQVGSYPLGFFIFFNDIPDNVITNAVNCPVQFIHLKSLFRYRHSDHPGAKPHESGRILKNGCDGAVGQAVIIGDIDQVVICFN